MAVRRSIKVLAGVTALVAIGAAAGVNLPTTTSTPTARPTVAVTAAPTVAPRPTAYRASILAADVRSMGYSVAVSDDAGPVRCDYTLGSTRQASVTWTDGATAYTVTGSPDDTARLYLDLLDAYTWPSCRYNVKQHVLAGYGDGASVASLSSSLAEYAATMRETLNAKPTPAPTPIRHEYVVNLESRVFHWPSCFQAKQMKGKKRKLVTMTRDEMISKGYDPCGNCNP